MAHPSWSVYFCRSFTAAAPSLLPLLHRCRSFTTATPSPLPLLHYCHSFTAAAPWFCSIVCCTSIAQSPQMTCLRNFLCRNQRTGAKWVAILSVPTLAFLLPWQVCYHHVTVYCSVCTTACACMYKCCIRSVFSFEDIRNIIGTFDAFRTVKKAN